MSAHGGAMRRTGPGAFGLGLLLLGLAVTVPAAAQDVEGTDPGWLALLGCWEVVDDEVEAAEDAVPSLVCVRPVEEGPGAELVTVTDGEIAGRETLHADARRRESARDGCDGWERGTFSDDGHRVYLRSEHLCPGDVERTSTGLLGWVSPYEWMEVRTVEVRGAPRTWVRRYRVASSESAAAVGLDDLAVEPSMAVESARMAAAATLRVDDVIDAAEHLHADAVAAWIAEQGDPLDVDAGALVRMADAGVPESAIDVAVAVSYPDRFVVDRSGAVEEQAPARDRGRGYRGRRHVGGFGIGGWYPGYYYRYSPYRFYGSYYSPWGYSPWGHWGFGYGYRPSVVFVGPRSDRGGRVVNGRGYTRGSSSGDRTARPSRRPRPSSDRSPGPAPSVGRSGGAGAAVSPSGGYRSGGSSTGRTARPRGGGSGSEDGSGSR